MSQFGVHATFVPGSTERAAAPDAVLACVIGTAPVHLLADGVPVPVNTPVVVRSEADYRKAFGNAGDDAGDYSLSVAADVLFNRYSAGAAVFVNVFDPEVHVDGGDDPDVTEVAAADIIGADDGAGTLTGIEVAEAVFTETGLVPTVFVAPGFSDDAGVAVSLRRKAARHTESFYGFTVLDVDADNTAAAIATKATAGTGGVALDDPFAVQAWPDVVAQIPTAAGQVERVEPSSLHVVGALYDAVTRNGGIPASPSNKTMQGLRPAVSITRADVTALRRAGLVTLTRFGPGGYRLAGNHTSAYLDGAPTAETVEDGLIGGDIAARLSANYIANSAVLATLRLVDDPTRKAQIDRVLDSLRLLGNRVTASGATLGFAAEYRAEDNTPEDLADGVVTIRLSILPPPAMETVNIPISIDLGYFAALSA